MSREWVVRALLRSYPARTRASVGAEMVGTVLDISDGSGHAFARECVALVIAGARARARARAPETIRGQLADGYVLAGQIWIAFLLSKAIAQLLRSPAPPGGFVFVLTLGPILGLSLIGARRTAGMAATAWFVCLILIFGEARLKVAVSFFIPLTSSLVMATCQPNRRRDLRRLLWLAPIVIVSLLPQSGQLNAFSTVQIGGLILGSVVGVAILPISPRLLVACAVAWISIGLMAVVLSEGPQSVPFLALSAPLVLLAATGHLALARRRARA